ncbi:hypothetical protein [Butyrivibrio sp. MC2013]|uniref:hypothetical protein n=1 Tax=Butyrivibrio sp. MC2013 TaxID=1280686 RepID=UPI000404F658|nr:hypothetical protein [Butyrivibrio sp. MC2013]
MVIFVLLALLGQLLASSSQILLKKSAGIHYSNFIRQYLNVWVIMGYGLLGISMIIAVVCYSRMDYMKVVILEPVGYILVMFMSRFFFKEKISLKKLLGMGLIISGILIFYLL